MSDPTDLLNQPPIGTKICVCDFLYSVTRDLREPSECPHDWYFICEYRGGSTVGEINSPGPICISGEHERIELPRQLVIIWRLGPDGAMPRADDPEVVNREEMRSRMRGIRNVPNQYDVPVWRVRDEDDYGCSGSGEGEMTVTDDQTPVITGISPSVWDAGSTTSGVTISGEYFGSNAPTLSFSPGTGIGYALTSHSDSTIVANITVASGTSNEDVM